MEKNQNKSILKTISYILHNCYIYLQHYKNAIKQIYSHL